MASGFELDQRLAASSDLVLDWPLSQLRLARDGRWPWVLLVPRRAAVREFTDLDEADYALLMRETRAACGLMQELAGERRPDKLNVAMIGNLVPQMHVHVVGRYVGDAGWPGPIWGHGEPEPRTDEAQEAIAARWREAARAVALAPA